jgi:hypothetical protein
MFNNGMTQGQTLSLVQTKLTNLRAALDVVTDLYGWSSGVAVADLVALGFSSADATTLLSAIADAHALAQIYSTGQPPSTYPQAATTFVYSASQRQVIGPQ